MGGLGGVLGEDRLQHGDRRRALLGRHVPKGVPEPVNAGVVEELRLERYA
jgi:hypothetical protein